jgi:signal peptidase I
LEDTVEVQLAALLPSSKISRSRSPWLAAALNFFVPGLGYQYAGFYRRAVVLLVTVPALATLGRLLAFAIPIQGANVAAPYAVGFVLQAMAAAAAAIHVRGDSGRTTSRLSRWYAVVAGFLLAIGLGAGWAVVGATFAQVKQVNGHAMEGTLLDGERVLFSMWDYGWRPPFAERPIVRGKVARRGDVVVFRYPKEPSTLFVKRVIGLPGERIEIRKRVLYVDGRRYDEPYARFQKEYRDDVEALLAVDDNVGPLTVPPNSYFVLGDNRDVSNDSRAWGFVPAAHVLGRARLINTSTDASTEAIRWERLGLPID